MNLFDPRAALAEIEKRGSPPATSATSATSAPDIAVYVASVADVAGPLARIRENANVVSLEDWRTLTEWERHGPNGRHWNGITRKWEVPS